jgi:hypothetical protein
MEQNHVGGEKHVPELFLPFCKKDHAEFHLKCRQAGVDFHHIENRSLALVQSFKAILVGLWMVVDLLEKHLRSELESESRNETDK